MKKFLFLLFACLAVSATNGIAKSKKDTISVPHIQCGMCESTIEKALREASYIEHAKADAEQDVVYVTYNESKVKRSDVERLISRAGYATSKFKADPTAQNALHACCKPGAQEDEPVVNKSKKSTKK
jgi:periplasmic mercuric ion binding protein